MGLENGYGCTVNGAQTLFPCYTNRLCMHSRPLSMSLLAAPTRDMKIQHLLAKLRDKALPSLQAGTTPGQLIPQSFCR